MLESDPLAPVLMVEDQFYGLVSPAEASRMLDKYLKGDKAKAAPKAETAAATVPAPAA